MNTLSHNHYLGLGKVFHRRRVPKAHQFTMSIYMLWVSLNSIHNSQNTLNIGKLSRFAPEDYWKKNAINAYQLQSQLIDEWRSRGLAVDNICVLTNPRTLNTTMNPLSVFYCYHASQLVGLIAEVTNTPWGERHHYFLVVGDAEVIDCDACADWHKNQLVFRFNKAFHVSPFYPMDLDYEMRFQKTDDKLIIMMRLSKENTLIFDASLDLSLQQLNEQTWRTAFWKKPWITMQVRTRIYVEALRLLMKRTPFFSHPDRIKQKIGRKKQ